MLYSIVGSSGFADGMKLYFERFDGQAVVCEDFVMAMCVCTPRTADVVFPDHAPFLGLLLVIVSPFRAPPPLWAKLLRCHCCGALWCAGCVVGVSLLILLMYRCYCKAMCHWCVVSVAAVVSLLLLWCVAGV